MRFAFVAAMAGGLSVGLFTFPAFSAPGRPPNTTPRPAPPAPVVGDARHGAALFAAKCVKCHGAGGIGSSTAPPLQALKTRRGAAAAIVWIKDPQPPMPKLYPRQLSNQDVDDIIVYLESL